MIRVDIEATYRTKVGEEICKGKSHLSVELRNNAKRWENFETGVAFKHPFQICPLGPQSQIIQNH